MHMRCLDSIGRDSWDREDSGDLTPPEWRRNPHRVHLPRHGETNRLLYEVVGVVGFVFVVVVLVDVVFVVFVAFAAVLGLLSKDSLAAVPTLAQQQELQWRDTIQHVRGK